MQITLTDEDLRILGEIQGTFILNTDDEAELVSGAIRLLGQLVGLHRLNHMTHPFDFRPTGDVS
jgi:hypothetical protein